MNIGLEIKMVEDQSWSESIDRRNSKSKMLSLDGYGHDSGFSTGQRETLDDIVFLGLPDEHKVLVIIIGRVDWIRKSSSV